MCAAGSGFEHGDRLQAPSHAASIANALQERQRLLREGARLVVAALEDAQPRQIRQKDADRPDITVRPLEVNHLFEPTARLV